MNTLIEEIDNAKKPQNPISIEEQLLSLWYAQISRIGDILGTSGSFVSKSLKDIPIRNYSEKTEGNRRLILLTKDWVEKLLKMSEKKKNTSSKSPEKIPDVTNPVAGISFADFEKQLFARGRTKSVKSIWNSLVRNHKELFIISYKDSVCFYQINAVHIERALTIAQEYAKNIDARIKKTKYTDTRPLRKARVRFLSNIE